MESSNDNSEFIVPLYCCCVLVLC